MLSKEPGFNDFQQITTHLFIGNQLSAIALKAMHKAGLKQVLKVNGDKNHTFLLKS